MTVAVSKNSHLISTMSFLSVNLVYVCLCIFSLFLRTLYCNSLLTTISFRYILTSYFLCIRRSGGDFPFIEEYKKTIHFVNDFNESYGKPMSIHFLGAVPYSKAKRLGCGCFG